MRIAAIIGACLLALAGAAAQQARDTPARSNAPAGAGSIAGIVRDGGGDPVRRAIVVLSGGGDSGHFTFVTDDDGVFVFADLKAGSYRLSATKPAYVKADYGAKRPTRPGTTIALASGQQLTGLTLTLQRGAVITGRIVNENGEPGDGTTVRLMQSVFASTGRGLQMAAGSTSVSTDDRGVYRFFGLPAGEYFVVANPLGAAARGIRLTTADDIAGAERDIATGARVGGSAPARATPAPAATIGSYTSVFYPGVTTATAAIPVVVGAGEERNGIDFRITLAPTARVEGTVTAAGGSLGGPIQVLLLQPPTGMPGGNALTRTTSVAPPDGRFSFTGVSPGEYLLVASLDGTAWAMSGNGSSSTVVAAPPTRGAADGPLGGAGGRPAEIPWGMSNVAVAGRDVNNIVLTLQPSLTVSGRLAFDGIAAHKANEWTAILDPVADVTQVTSTRLSAVVSADGRFTVTGVTPGRYTLLPVAFPTSGETDSARPWALSSVVAAQRDVTETGFDVGASASDLVVTLTDRVAELTGVLQNTSGQPTADYTIILCATDRAFWKWQSRRILSTRPATDGRFTFRGMPPGKYFLAALTDVDENQWFDPAFLEQIVPPNSVPVTISDGRRTVQDVRVAQ